jgi:hypothetical protein
MESHPGAGVAGKPSGREAEGPTRIGGDELRDDEPHF